MVGTWAGPCARVPEDALASGVNAPGRRMERGTASRSSARSAPMQSGEPTAVEPSPRSAAAAPPTPPRLPEPSLGVPVGSPGRRHPWASDSRSALIPEGRSSPQLMDFPRHRTRERARHRLRTREGARTGGTRTSCGRGGVRRRSAASCGDGRAGRCGAARSCGQAVWPAGTAPRGRVPGERRPYGRAGRKRGTARPSGVTGVARPAGSQR